MVEVPAEKTSDNVRVIGMVMQVSMATHPEFRGEGDVLVLSVDGQERWWDVRDVRDYVDVRRWWEKILGVRPR